MSNRTIAITGMACLFPGSANLSDYWRNILLANVCTGPVPDDHSWSLED
ncbi:MAG: acyl transferase domain-containing protein, partial [Myxococcota bacterium]